VFREYWDSRYRKGGNSGHGSVGQERSWKWSIINEHVSIEDCSVLDIGCGDLSFWGDTRPKEYIGIDYSEVVIRRNREMFPDLTFHREDLTGPVVELPAVDVALCLDVLFHQPSQRDFDGIIEYLSDVRARTLFVTNFDDPIPGASPHMSFRSLSPIENWEVSRTYESPLDTKRLYVLWRRNK
jgi:SAM-dependent methyltransferase